MPAWLRTWLGEAWAAVRRAPPRAILGVGFGCFLVYAFPGFMSSDSVLQIMESRSAVYSNAHPPIMAVEWRLLEWLVAGPLLMLLVQGGLFLGGLYRTLCHRLAPRAAAVIAVAVLMFPPVLTTMAVIWKDSQMAGFLLAGTAALLSPRLRNRLIGVALISAACAFRYNAAAAALPLIGLLFVWRPGQRWWQRYAIAAGAFAIAVVAAFQLNSMLTVEAKFLSPAFTDIVGVLYHEPQRSDDDLRHLLRGTPLRITTGIHDRARSLYWPRTSWQVTRGDTRMFDDPTTPEHVAALGRAWRELVLGDPLAYLEHRGKVFAELLGLSEAALWSPVYAVFAESGDQAFWMEHSATWSRLQARAIDAMYLLAYQTPLFRPYLYAALGLVLLVLCCRDRLSLALLASGLGYELGFFPTTSTPDLRYSHWMITCTCIAALLLFAERYRAGRGRAPAQGPAR